MIELLAPAGDIEKLKIAFLYGADAVYLGGYKYGLRANAKNFTMEDIKNAAEYAHERGKKIYITVNIILHEGDIDGLEDYLWELSRIGVDAIIVSDFYIVNLVNKKIITLEVHISTQASVLNSYTAKFYKRHGVKRIVLAREASESDIKSIKNETGLDLECFIHGAMCTSFSGRCVLSNHLTNRDANRGGCAQICRWSFDKDGSPEFTLKSKDLNMIPFIKSMIDNGVNSFKIEGRMRGIYYIATVVDSYRRMIDKILNNNLTDKDTDYYLKILNRCANRDSMPQFYHGVPNEEGQYFTGVEEVSNQDFLGIVKEYNEDKKMLTIEQRNYFKVGDVVEFFGPSIEPITYKIEKIYDENDNVIDVANHPNMIVKLPFTISLHKDDMMRIKVFDKE